MGLTRGEQQKIDQANFRPKLASTLVSNAQSSGILNPEGGELDAGIYSQQF
jgi:hypothetical protein